jgi:hypothetical protein
LAEYNDDDSPDGICEYPEMGDENSDGNYDEHDIYAKHSKPKSSTADASSKRHRKSASTSALPTESDDFGFGDAALQLNDGKFFTPPTSPRFLLPNQAGPTPRSFRDLSIQEKLAQFSNLLSRLPNSKVSDFCTILSKNNPRICGESLLMNVSSVDDSVWGQLIGLVEQ